jgi:hypothetical protein
MNFAFELLSQRLTITLKGSYQIYYFFDLDDPIDDDFLESNEEDEEEDE